MSGNECDFYINPYKFNPGVTATHKRHAYTSYTHMKADERGFIVEAIEAMFLWLFRPKPVGAVGDDTSTSATQGHAQPQGHEQHTTMDMVAIVAVDGDGEGTPPETGVAIDGGGTPPPETELETELAEVVQ